MALSQKIKGRDKKEEGAKTNMKRRASKMVCRRDKSAKGNIQTVRRSKNILKLKMPNVPFEVHFE